MRHAVLFAAAVCGASALNVQPSFRPAAQAVRRAAQVQCVATTDEEKALLKASRKVTMAAKKFGVTQGKQAQKWVEAAVKGGQSTPSSLRDGLMEMQLALFDECSLDDESDRCKALTAAIEDLTSAVADRKSAPKSDEFVFQVGPTAIQTAATKLRASATKFGPEQKEAADEWIKKITSGSVSDGKGLLEESIVLFGECVLSEDSTPSDCQLLSEALDELQEAIDTCKPEVGCETDEVVAEVANDAAKDEVTGVVVPAPAKVTGRKRKAVKKFFSGIFGKKEKVASWYDSGVRL